ncbi:hypothetical protein ACVIRO_007635 [Rhizobium ruizarguesonis]
MLAEVYKDFTLVANERGAYASHEYDPLESAFLEPERVSLDSSHPFKSVAVVERLWNISRVAPTVPAAALRPISLYSWETPLANIIIGYKAMLRRRFAK